jgi:hypothetical protein
MPRGIRAEIGDKNVNPNGYEYTKTATGWIGTHVLIMEKFLGRKLEPGEYVTFKNGHEPPITIGMLELRKRGDKRTPEHRLAEIDARIEELQLERESILEEMDA